MGFWGDSQNDKNNKARRTGRSNKTRESWFKSGHMLSNDDTHISMFNLGLGGRERRAMNSENSRPWGQKGFSEDAIKARAKEAQRRAKSKKKGKKPVEKRETPFGMVRATKKNRSWWD